MGGILMRMYRFVEANGSKIVENMGIRHIYGLQCHIKYLACYEYLFPGAPSAAVVDI
jgi:hypothetical protein